MKSFLTFLLSVYIGLSLIFFGIRLAPGDPVEQLLGPDAKESEIEFYRETLGLNLPLFVQYKNFWVNIVTFDWGKSVIKNRNVSEMIYQALRPTLVLAIFSVFISSILGSLLGVFSALHYNGIFDRVIRPLSFMGLSIPIFSLGPLLTLLFAIKLNWLPVSEWGGIKHSILPIITLALPLSCVLLRIVRLRFIEANHGAWVSYLRAKGMGEFSIVLRVYKSCLSTLLTVISLQFSVVVTGTVITETLFDIPGVGLLLYESIQNRDYPIVEGVMVYSICCYLLLFMLTDFLNKIVDPRQAHASEI